MMKTGRNGQKRIRDDVGRSEEGMDDVVDDVVNNAML
jgi:hypothetical protein